MGRSHQSVKSFLSGDNFYLSSKTEQDSTGCRLKRLETVDLEAESVFVTRAAEENCVP